MTNQTIDNALGSFEDEPAQSVFIEVPDFKGDGYTVKQAIEIDAHGQKWVRSFIINDGDQLGKNTKQRLYEPVMGDSSVMVAQEVRDAEMQSRHPNAKTGSIPGSPTQSRTAFEAWLRSKRWVEAHGMYEAYTAALNSPIVRGLVEALETAERLADVYGSEIQYSIIANAILAYRKAVNVRE